MSMFLIRTLIAVSTYVMHAAEFVRAKAIAKYERQQADDDKAARDAERVKEARKQSAAKAAAAAQANAESEYKRSVAKAQAHKAEARKKAEKIKAL